MDSDGLDLLAPPAFEVEQQPSAAPVRESMVLNLGPHHPSTHGVLRIILELEGERVLQAVPDIGYLHTGIEKTFEAKTYVKGTVLAPRMGYLSPIHNLLAYVLAVEKLLQVEVPARATVARVILCELDRIASHLIWLGTHALDLGASSVFLYALRERELVLDIMELVGGARMFPLIIRPGGLAYDQPPEFEPCVRAFLDLMPQRLDEYEALLTENPIWKDRLIGTGVIGAEDAVGLGVSGPILRAAGVDWDLRKALPYCGYEEYDFDVPLHTAGDAYARYVVRMAEMRQALEIARQALVRLPDGPFLTDDRKVAPPPKEELAYSMEAVIHHFKLWTEGFTVPAGEAYVAVEAPRGEMGFYVVSDGSARPWRVHMRSPSFVNLQALPLMARGGLVADLVALIASLDPVLGEVDR